MQCMCKTFFLDFEKKKPDSGEITLLLISRLIVYLQMVVSKCIMTAHLIKPTYKLEYLNNDRRWTWKGTE